MKTIATIICCLILHNVLASEPIHYLDAGLTKVFFNNYPPKYYMKTESTCCYELKASSSLIYTQVPGLVLSFHHFKPTLYEISFHGHCRIASPSTFLSLRMRVDGHLIIVNSLSSSMVYSDGSDGAYAASNSYTHLSWFPCSKSDLIYLSPGVHVIDAVAITDGTVRIDGGVLRIKLTQFDQETDINLPLVTPP